MAADGDFVVGLLTAGYLVSAGFFLRFWRRSGDALFLAFASAFCLLALNHAIPALRGGVREEQAGVYLLRLLAFFLIIGAVLAKNLPKLRR